MFNASLPPLNALRVFEAAARLGSFRAAAAELHVTPSAVSHQVSNLEAHLGLALFERRGRRLALTDTGDAYRRRIHDALTRLADATNDATRDRSASALTVMAAPSFAAKWLMPRLDEFLRLHPDLKVRVEATAGRQHLGDADVGILYGPPTDTDLIARPLVRERMLVLCSPGLLRRGPPLTRPEDLAQHVLIHARNRLPWRTWLTAHGLGGLPVRREMSVDRSTMAIEAAAEGVGVILESDFLAAQEIADGHLIEPFTDPLPAPPEDAYFLVWAKTAQPMEPLAQFIAWLEDLIPGAT